METSRLERRPLVIGKSAAPGKHEENGRTNPSMRGSLSSAAAVDFAKSSAPEGRFGPTKSARTSRVFQAGAGGGRPPAVAVCPRCEADATWYAQPSIRDRRTCRRRHLTGIQGTPPVNCATIVPKGRRRGSLRGRPMVVTPARRRSTGGSLGILQRALRPVLLVRGSGIQFVRGFGG